MPEPVWRRCDECDVPYVIVAVLNPRRHKWAPLPLSSTPEGVQGNFDINWNENPVEVHDADGRNLGPHPVGTYGIGEYRPHPPGHFLDRLHVRDDQSEHIPRVGNRIGNFRLAMDDDD